MFISIEIKEIESKTIIIKISKIEVVFLSTMRLLLKVE